MVPAGPVADPGDSDQGRLAPGRRTVDGHEVREAWIVREHLDDRFPHAESALQPLDLELLVPEDERDDHPLLAGAGGAPGTLVVRLVLLARVVVHHHVAVVGLNAAP